MLTELHIKGFKPWRETGTVRLAPVTGFFGANSSGKTALLQFLLMLKQTAESADRQQVLSLGGEDKSLVELGTFDDVFHQRQNDRKEIDSLKWKLDWTLGQEFDIADPDNKSKTLFHGSQITFKATIRKRPNSSPIAERIVYRFAGHEFGLERKGLDEKGKQGGYNLFVKGEGYEPRRTRGRAWDLPGPVKCYGFPDQARTYFQNTGFLSDFELQFEQLLDRLYYLGPLRDFPKRQYTWAGAEPADMGRRGEATVAALLAARGRGRYISPGYRKRHRPLEKHIAHWLKKLNLIHEFSVEEIAPGSNLYRVEVRKSAQTGKVLIPDIGFGISQVLPVLVICFYVPEGSTIILEQPELHLHPSVQAGLADVFIDALKNRNVQIIFESHSEHLLRRLQRRIAEGKIESNEAALYFCQHEEGASKLLSLELDMFGNILNWPSEFFGDEFGEIEALTRAALERKMSGAA